MYNITASLFLGLDNIWVCLICQCLKQRACFCKINSLSEFVWAAWPQPIQQYHKLCMGWIKDRYIICFTKVPVGTVSQSCENSKSLLIFAKVKLKISDASKLALSRMRISRYLTWSFLFKVMKDFFASVKKFHAYIVVNIILFWYGRKLQKLISLC